MTDKDEVLRDLQRRFNPETAVWTAYGEDTGTGVAEVAMQGEGDELIVALRNSTARDKVLLFNKGEWDAFVGGVQDGEFDLDFTVS